MNFSTILFLLLLRKKSESDFLAGLPAQIGFIPQRDSTRLTRWRQLLTFQKRMWTEMLEIRHGEVRSDRWITDPLAIAPAARAVGNACGKIPCRLWFPVTESSAGTVLGGYTGGIEIKKK
jgi:O6-methylguanine-DNA--protein-cysteine methyltransferase